MGTDVLDMRKPDGGEGGSPAVPVEWKKSIGRNKRDNGPPALPDEGAPHPSAHSPCVSKSM